MTSSNEFEQQRHQLITKLLHQVQTIDDSKQQELAIEQIALILLRSRPLCRQFNGMPLQGVYLEIYSRAKDDLQAHLRQQIAVAQQKSSRTINIGQIQPAYLYTLQKQIFQSLLNDNQLKKMGLAAQKFAFNSELRTYALTELIKAIDLSGRLCRPHIGKFSSSLYQTLYEEALAETFTYVCLNINLYDPNRGKRKFMNWVNFQLDKSILKCYSKSQKYSQYELPSFSDLEQTPQTSQLDNTPNLCQILQDYVVQNPDNIFTTAHIRNRPDANFNNIALAKFSGATWEQISQQFNIPVTTLSSFYNRWCRRFAPLLKTELEKHF